MDSCTPTPVRPVAAAILAALLLGACGAEPEPSPDVSRSAQPAAHAELERQRALRRALAAEEDAALERRFERQVQRESDAVLRDKLEHQEAILSQLLDDLRTLESSDAPDARTRREEIFAHLCDYAARIERSEKTRRIRRCFPN